MLSLPTDNAAKASARRLLLDLRKQMSDDVHAAKSEQICAVAEKLIDEVPHVTAIDGAKVYTLAKELNLLDI